MAKKSFAELETQFADNHRFLAEGLLVPFLNQTNNNRLQMFNSHVGQCIQLSEAEVPQIYTGFENQVGEYSTGYHRLKGEWVVIKRFDKNRFNYALLIQNTTTKVYDIIYRHEAEHLTEDFGYRNDNTFIDSLETGSVIKDQVLYHSMNYDKDLNFKYGKNLKVCFLPYKGYTNEDGIVVSTSVAEGMRSNFVKKVTVSLNTNDIMLNLYGDEHLYKSFPNIGEQVAPDGILMATRRIVYSDIINKLQDKQLTRILEDDSVRYVNKKATVIDIDIWSNHDVKLMSNEPYNSQILSNYAKLLTYYDKVISYLEPIMTSKTAKYSNELRVFYNRLASYRDPLSEFEDSGKRFDNMVLEFTLLYEEPLKVGSKITARYGEILPS